MTAESMRHWDEKELLAAQKEDHQTLAALERLASTQDFSWPEKGEGCWDFCVELNLQKWPAILSSFCLQLFDKQW